MPWVALEQFIEISTNKKNSIENTRLTYRNEDRKYIPKLQALGLFSLLSVLLTKCGNHSCYQRADRWFEDCSKVSRKID